MLKVAIIGKPNVGKSSIFNRICRKKLAIIDDTAGVTRDNKEHLGYIGEEEVIAIDTAGWEEIKHFDDNKCSKINVKKNGQKNKKNCEERVNSVLLLRKMLEKTNDALQRCDIVLFVLDAIKKMTSDDLELARIVRKANKPTIVLMNKCDDYRVSLDIDEGEIYGLGFVDVVRISARHNVGFEVLEELFLVQRSAVVQKEQEDSSAQDNLVKSGKCGDFLQNQGADCLSLAIVGRPNAGKSTLFNSLLGSEIAITSSESGTTRDSLDKKIFVQEDGVKELNIIDTAGIRKKGRIQNHLENFAIGHSITAIRRAKVVLLVIDATVGIEKQDLSIARVAIQEGKALILVVNKYDLIDDKKSFVDNVEHFILHHLADISNPILLYISAQNGYNVSQIVKSVALAFKSWRKKINTGKLNRWLQNACEKHPPPLGANKRRMRLKYVVQKATQPPTLEIFCNKPKELPQSYIRYLSNSFCNYFHLNSIPLRFRIKSTKNPYIK